MFFTEVCLSTKGGGYVHHMPHGIGRVPLPARHQALVPTPAGTDIPRPPPHAGTDI